LEYKEKVEFQVSFQNCCSPLGACWNLLWSLILFLLPTQRNPYMDFLYKSDISKNEHLYACVDLSPNFLLGETLKKAQNLKFKKLYFIEFINDN
jgi:hypothetical protein